MVTNQVIHVVRTDFRVRLRCGRSRRRLGRFHPLGTRLLDLLFLRFRLLWLRGGNLRGLRRRRRRGFRPGVLEGYSLLSQPGPRHA